MLESNLQRLATTMNHQLAHSIAQHSAEANSWALLVAVAALSRLHFSSVMPCTATLVNCSYRFVHS